MLRVVKRKLPTKVYVGVSALIILIAFLLISLVMLISLQSFDLLIDVYKNIFTGIVNNQSDILVYAIPLIIASLALAIPFKMKFWNLGGEGQIIFGAIGAMLVASHLASQSPFIAIPLMIIFAFIFGGLYGLIVGLLKVFFKASEVIVSLMLNYVALFFLTFLQYDWPSLGTTPINSNLIIAEVPSFIFTSFVVVLVIALLINFICKQKKLNEGSFKISLYLKKYLPLIIVSLFTFVMLVIVTIFVPNCSISIFFVAISAGFTYMFLEKSKKGFEISVIASSPKAANYSGMSISKTTLLVSFLTGALLGVCGFVLISSEALSNATLSAGITMGIGYAAIVIALTGRMKVSNIILYSILFSVIHAGFENSSGLSPEISEVSLGIILFACLLFGFFSEYSIVNTKISENNEILEDDTNKDTDVKEVL